MSVTSIKVRMYNTGSVGDCLLVLFYKANTLVYKMLIDCGGWNAPKETIVDCVKDIVKTCKGQLDLLVVTHQHEDHVSGFNQARNEFDQLTIKELWMSWIEDSKDPIGQILREKYGKKLKELARLTGKALEKVAEVSQRQSTARHFSEVMKVKTQKLQHAKALIDLEVGDRHSQLAAGKRTNDDAMNYLKGKAKKVSYKLPGEVVINLPGAEGTRFFILGPPRDEDMAYFKMDTDKGEMYAAKAQGEMGAQKPRPKERIADSGIILKENESPFEEKFLYAQADKEKWMAEVYYADPEIAGRQIETDWLETAASIALRVNRLTNNTSLAMAIEYTKSGRVLLFPGDAQSGNWMGWHKPDVSEALKKAGNKTTKELLANTVFYKVGHHGSHNGTASQSGLELINNASLVAMLPLVQDKVPAEWGGEDNFPAHELYKVLISKTSGRVIRTDIGIETDELAEDARNRLLRQEKQQFTNAFKQGKNYVEYTIKA